MNAIAKAHFFRDRPNGFAMALMINFLWINASEVWRYFVIVRPDLLAAFADRPGIAPVTPLIALSWAAWDCILILAAVGYYSMHLRARGENAGQALLAATAFTVTVFGLLWLALINMGLATTQMAAKALPLAFAEQAVAALLTLWARKWAARPLPS